MEFIDFVFFFYMFIGLYMSSLMSIIYIQNREKLFSFPKGKPERVSIVVPCYNDSRNLADTIKTLLNLDYPKNMTEIIIVDDASTDNSVEIARAFEKKYSNVRVILNRKNSGGAAKPTNMGIRAAKYDYIAVADADSTPDRDALRKMIGFLQEDRTVGGVTCAVLAKHPVKFIQKLQQIEYAIIAWSRKLLDFVDSVYVTPGPFALYRKKVLLEVGLFDEKNITQDIEIVWRMLSHGYKARMCLATRVHSETPDRFGAWLKQRIRWNIGGKQCLWKYKSLFLRKGMLGNFVIPFFAVSIFLGVIGFGLFTYLFTRGLLVSFLSTKYSILAQSTVFSLQELSFSPSVINFFGFALFFVGLAFTFFGLSVMKLNKFSGGNIFNVLFYSLVYLTIYPAIIIMSIYKLIRGNYSW